MRFGIMYDFRNPRRWYIDPPVFYRAMLDQMVAAEGLGFDHVWLTEHHFTEDAYNPAPLSMAAAIAAVTERIRIGTFVMLMPFIHPVRAAEDITLADILSNGRFDIGVGQGYTHEEFNAFGIDRKERGPRLSEGIELMRKLFTEENLTFDGKFTRLGPTTLNPKPVQQPHPPIWVGARGPKAIRRAAELRANRLTRQNWKRSVRTQTTSASRSCAWFTVRNLKIRPGRKARNTWPTCSGITSACLPKLATSRAMTNHCHSKNRR
ncbi:MAG: LLM class flavin-dependent oxidoreductase, partial [Gammaproteobacteria bacterium]